MKRVLSRKIVFAITLLLLDPAALAARAASVDQAVGTAGSSYGADYSTLGADWSDAWSYGGTITRGAGTSTFTATTAYSGFYVGTTKAVMKVAGVRSVSFVASGAGLSQVSARLVSSASMTYVPGKLSTYIVARDGDWVTYTIPIADFAGIPDMAGFKLQAVSATIVAPFAVRSISVDADAADGPRTLYSAPNSEAAAAQTQLASSGSVEKANSLSRIVNTPTAVWLGDWTKSVKSTTASLMASANAANAIPQIVLYNIPLRDCTGPGPVGKARSDAYRAWIDEVRAGMGMTKAIVIIEPDALAHIPACLSSAGASERISMIAYAASVMEAQGSYVYVDAGNSAWLPAKTIAPLLERAGVGGPVGFSLNVSNYRPTNAEASYGNSISALLPGSPTFVIDVSRNGAAVDPTVWCNATQAKLGVAPTLRAGLTRVDGLLWIKRPGESDGTCNGGPSAGAFWVAGALALSAG